MLNPTPQTTRLEDYAPPAFVIDTVALDIDLQPGHTRVRATLTIARNPAVPGAGPLVLDGDGLSLLGVRLDGEPLAADAFDVTPDSLTVHAVPARFVFETEVRIDPEKNTQLMGLYVSQGTFFTQCEAEGFRRITYFLDRPDVMASYTVTLRADKAKYPVLLSNGNLVEEGSLPDGRHFAKWVDPHKKPCYLFALVAGQLVAREQRITSRSGGKHLLQVYRAPRRHSTRPSTR
jgi:aminopeptidase N